MPHKQPAIPKKAVAAKPKEKVPIAKAKPQAIQRKKPSNIAISPQIFKDIESSLNAIEETPQKEISSSLYIPQKLSPAPHFEPETNEINVSYQEYLLTFLQNTLELPEYGEIKAELEIDRNGNLIHLEILSSRSIENAEFLKRRLKELSFPCLNDFGIIQNRQNFTITFRNAENH